ncbi:MAG: class I SAM-dependent methyltransferase [Gemmatimonadota bacterium]|nr:class I SAM-dependent methyltransferase [Gemmatimonadota bacterium]
MKPDNTPQVARFWNTVAHDFDAIYTGEKSPIGRALDRWLRRDIYERFDWVMENAGDARAKRIVDIGCGSGRFVSALARRGAAHVTGVDLAPEMLKLAREVVAKDGVADVCAFVLADVLHWKTDEQFDLSIAIGFWDYVADPLPRLRVIRRITGGAFLSAWPRLWTWRMPLRKVRLTALGCPVYFFRREEVHRLLQEAGFRVTKFDVVGKLYCVEARPV